MRYLLLIVILFFLNGEIFAFGKDSVHHYDLPDSVTATSFITDVTVSAASLAKDVEAGIRTSEVELKIEGDKKHREVEFKFPAGATLVTTGLNVEKDDNELEWKYEWKPSTSYKLLIVTAADSAANFILYSGYIFLPEESKWKLIGTCRINGQWTSIRSPQSFYLVDKKQNGSRLFSNTWIQRSNGSWKKLSNDEPPARPVINPMPSIDSVQQFEMEKAKIDKAIAEKKIDITNMIEGVYYKIVEPGSGKTVSVSDTVTAYYKLRMYNTTDIIDQASAKPATFPLARLIKAWQLTIPLVKTGGKLKIIIPSGFGYSIRTRGAKIPPNSILEFDIEVVDTKPSLTR